MNINSRTSKVNFTGYASGSIASFTGLREAPIKIRSQISAIQSGSGTPAPDNIRPISGWSVCNVVRCGTNLWDEEWVSGYLSATGTITSDSGYLCSKNLIPVLPNTTYYILAPTGKQRFFAYYDANGNFIERVNANFNTTFTTPDNAYFMRFDTNSTYGNTYNNDISINYPSTDHDYHAYTGNTYTIQLGDTYYGGSLNVTTGVLTITNKQITFSDLTWSYDAEYNRFKSNKITDIYGQTSYEARKMPFLCSSYEVVDDGRPVEQTTNNQIYWGGKSGAAQCFYVNDNRYTDPTDLLTNMGTTQIVYRLATPFTVQLTPTQVEQLLGSNNVWADTGDVEVYFVTI